MDTANKLITQHIDLWTSTVKTKSTSGRGSSKKRELYGIKKLRELILELAVRGLLVPKDPNDEPASELLKRIEAEKAKLIKDKKIKKTKSLEKIKPTEHQYLEPNGWSFARLGNLVEMYNGRAFKSSEWSEIGIPIVRIQNLNDKHAPFNHFEGDLSDQHRINHGSFLISWSGTPGTSFGAFLWKRGEAALNQHINNCLFHGEELDLRFMQLAVNGQMNHFIANAQGGVGLKHVTKGTLNNAVLCIPPLAEQKRIVAKVDELMALCDQLEQQQEHSIETHETLVKHLLDTLTTTSDPAQFQQAWHRIQANFHLLFTTESSINHLKQTILQLAVTGKLVPQNPKDDSRDCFPAWEKHESKDESLGHPTQWMSVPLGKLGEWRGGGTPSKGDSKFWDGEIPWVCPKDMKRPIIHKSIDQITAEAIDKSSAKLIPKNSLLMVVRGMILAHSFPVARSGREVTINQDMKALLPDYLDTVTYLHLALNALKAEFLNTVERSSHGTCKLLTKDLQEMLIPIPPLAEQHRIVTKVDELMTLCDQLKTNLTTAQTTQRHLTDTLATTTLNHGFSVNVQTPSKSKIDKKVSISNFTP